MMTINRRITKAYFHRACRQYVPLIRKLAFRIGVDDTHVEELTSCAPDELLKCMICYSLSGSFMTFFYGRLSGLFQHLRDTELRARRVQTMPMSDMVSQNTSDSDPDSHMMIEEYLSCLDKEEREIITAIYFKEQTTREISYSRGIVASTVCRIKIRAMNKMRQKYKIGLELDYDC